MEIQSKDICMVDIHKITPNAKNANQHTPEQIERLMKLIDYQGFRNPLIVSNRTGFLIAGHGRLEAAKKLGMEKLPVIYQDFENEAQEYSYLISDNEISRWSSLDNDAVFSELKNLELDDIELLGIEDFEIPEVEILDPQTDEDEVPEVENPITKRGDIWLLGKHRLMCGDSTMIDDVEKLMAGEKADMVFTDIPYSISQKSNGLRNIDFGDWDKDVEDIWQNCFYPQFADSFYYFCGDEQLSGILKMFKEHKLMTRNFVWHKTNPTPMNGDKLWQPSQELCAYGKKSNAIFNEKCKHSFWEGSPDSDRVHPCQKPVALIDKCVLASSNNSVLDFFGGSGSTMISCEKNNRKNYSMELDEKYCDVIINRWQNYTGKKATLESTGETYEELQKERL